MQPLTSAQRKKLRSMAHHLKPVVYVGRQGVTEALVSATDDALDAHELIKVKFNDYKEQKRELSEGLASDTNSEVAGIVGHVLILYRRQEDDEKRRIEI